jgi:hypothetical protein
MDNPETQATLDRRQSRDSGNIGQKTIQRLGQHWTEDNPETRATLDRRQSRDSGNIGQRTIQRLGQHWTEDNPETQATLDRGQSRDSGNIGQKTQNKGKRNQLTRILSNELKKPRWIQVLARGKQFLIHTNTANYT